MQKAAFSSNEEEFEIEPSADAHKMEVILSRLPSFY